VNGVTTIVVRAPTNAAGICINAVLLLSVGSTMSNALQWWLSIRLKVAY
jgi:hypothetical protein